MIGCLCYVLVLFQALLQSAQMVARETEDLPVLLAASLAAGKRRRWGAARSCAAVQAAGDRGPPTRSPAAPACCGSWQTCAAATPPAHADRTHVAQPLAVAPPAILRCLAAGHPAAAEREEAADLLFPQGWVFRSYISSAPDEPGHVMAQSQT